MLREPWKFTSILLHYTVFPLSQVCLKYEAHVALLNIKWVPLHIKVAEEGCHVVPYNADDILGAIKEGIVVKHV